MGALFETSYLGSKVEVFATYLQWTMLTQKTTVPLAQIASIELPPLLFQVVIETTGGKKLKIPVSGDHRKQLMEEIYAAQAGGR